ncbi:MAG: hypothetical protein R6W31_08225 [Bacteroidales bacterium]
MHFVFPIFLIAISAVSSLLMAKISRDQNLAQSLFAQRALYYYLFYFLLHQLKIRIKDLERIFVTLGMVYVLFYVVQFVLYPRIIFDAFILEDRGTIRIYMTGADYMTIAFFMSVQGFLRTTRTKYLIFALAFFSIFVLTGGRQTMAIMILVVILFLIIDRKVKSRIFLGLVGLIGAFTIFIIFQPIFEALLLQSNRDIRLGENYVRIQGARFYLTDFFRNPAAYITGNGMYHTATNYGKEIYIYNIKYGYYLGDIGVFGNYVIYGAFFILGIFTICIRALRIRIEANYQYIKYMFVAMILALVTAGGFSDSDVICFVVCLLYIIDQSSNTIQKKGSEIISNEKSLNYKLKT